MPIISGGGGSGAVSGVAVTGTAAAGQVPVATSATAGAWTYPPGFEISYTEITSPVNVASTTEATGTTIISPAASVFDGTPVVVEFFCSTVTLGTAGTESVVVSLFESATQITRLVSAVNNSATALKIPFYGKYRFTPTAASHTYTITAFANSVTGTPSITAGSGGTGGTSPAFVRFTKA